ncbi:MAG: hypothetical protein JW936_03065 [Sedimentisphaerales bacterium]|nr:hypothetical protein [Sedimentisphaerales bacterium]
MAERNQDNMDILLAYRLGIADDSLRAEAEKLLTGDEGRSLDEALQRTLKPLGAWQDVEAPSGLADKTLDFIAQHEQAQRMAKASAAIAQRGRDRESRGRWILGSMRDVIAVAASIMIVFLVSQTPLHYARQRSQEIACANQLGSLGGSYASYASDYDGYLPYMARSSNEPWYVGQAGSNTRNMFLLIRNGYARPKDFLCPGVPFRTQMVISVDRNTNQATIVDFRCSTEVGYSSRLMTDGSDAQVAYLGNAALMADRNPLFADFEGRGARELDLEHNSRLLGVNSPNHAGRGQNVLRNDRSVQFEQERYAGQRLDDIYTIESVTQYSGTEVPASQADTFIAP